MEMDQVTDSNITIHESLNTTTITPPTRSRVLLMRASWIALFFFSLITFTIFKLPEERIQGYVLGTVSGLLSDQGISFTAGKTDLSILFGPSLTFKEVQLRLPQSQTEIRLDRVTLSPSLLPLLLKKQGASFVVELGESRLDGSVSMRAQDIKVQLKIKNLDLKRTGILSQFLNISGGGVIDGDVNLDGSMQLMNSFSGNIQLQLSKISLDSQNMSGFNIPAVGFSEGKIDLLVEQGKAKIQTLQIGKAGNSSDDIHATITGELALASRFESSTLKAKAKFDLSKKILEFPQFALFGAILTPAKQSDGSYAYDLTGPIFAINPVPVAP